MTKRALAVWVSHPRSPVPIQATGGFFPDDAAAKAAPTPEQKIRLSTCRSRFSGTN